CVSEDLLPRSTQHARAPVARRLRDWGIPVRPLLWHWIHYSGVVDDALGLPAVDPGDAVGAWWAGIRDQKRPGGARAGLRVPFLGLADDSDIATAGPVVAHSRRQRGEMERGRSRGVRRHARLRLACLRTPRLRQRRLCSHRSVVLIAGSRRR